MSWTDLLVFQRQQKKTFKVPNKIREFRTRIEAESRENYPSVDRYEEILEEIEPIYSFLNVFIADKEYAKEAMRIKDTIKRELAQLTGKIERTMQ
jgi:hypothetical protein